MLNDEQLAKLADTMECNEKYTEDFFECNYANQLWLNELMLS